MEDKIRLNMLKGETLLSPFATKSKDAIRIEFEENDIRPPFFRDTDRIIHTSSYTRYADKTQVFSNIDNDNISRRFIHVQLVSKIARTIGRALNLNEDLIEAIALSHDLGHVPFGHVGESILNEISLKNYQGNFMHNVQSVRNLMNIENNGNGLNITIQVLDGVLCHNGEFVQDKYYPKKKSAEDFIDDYNNCYKDSSYYKKLVPMTLEGCVVRISDIIAYIGRDIEDAINLGVIEESDLPKEITDVLGSNNKDIINNIVLDIINNSIDRDYLKMSPSIYKSLVDLKKFNYNNIYEKANNKKKIAEYKLMFETVFNGCLEQLKIGDKKALIYVNFINNMSGDYLSKNSNERIVIDYISGMTDDYFIKEYNLIKRI
ncbi:MAG: HD domain-containing protein [Bacilli bacterium]|nr:HD domain-containing protein [Bacilli bacterium]